MLFRSLPMGDLGGFGGHFIFLSLGEQTATDELGNYIGKFDSYMGALDFSYYEGLTHLFGLGDDRLLRRRKDD